MYYCRYCTQAVAQSEEIAWCEYQRKMVGKYAHLSACKGYEFCRIDAFYAFRGLEVNDPKALYTPRTEKANDGEQLNLLEEF